MLKYFDYLEQRFYSYIYNLHLRIFLHSHMNRGNLSPFFHLLWFVVMKTWNFYFKFAVKGKGPKYISRQNSKLLTS